MTLTILTVLPFIAGDSRARVNHARGFEFIQAQELSNFFLLLPILLITLLHRMYRICVCVQAPKEAYDTSIK